MRSPKQTMRFVSLLLSLSLAAELASVPLANASVDPAMQNSQNQRLQAVKGELPNKPLKTKLELKTKRTKFSTRYLNPDGSFTEEVSSEPIYYQDSSKQWKAIDNTLKAASAHTYANTANDFTATFPNQAGTSDLVSVSKDNYKVSFAPVKGQAVKGQAVKGTTKDNSITYAGLFSNADAEYQVKGGGVKEDLVLHQYSGQNTFRYELHLTGVHAVTAKDGTLTFVNAKGQPIWTMEKPFMTDAKGKTSDQVQMTLQQENGKTYVDVTADDAFLKAPSTAYPVKIDPTIDNWDDVQDNLVSSAFPTSIYQSNTYMDVGQNANYFGTTRSYVKFALPSLPSGATITSANFNAYQTVADSSAVSVGLYRVTSDWGSNITWNTQPTVGSTAESTVNSSASNSYWQWFITKLVTDWYTGTQANYGFQLKATSESTAPVQSFNTVNSSNNTPRLTINYTVDPIGTESFWSYSKDGVNPANGNLVLHGKDAGLEGRGETPTVERTYNSRAASTAGSFGYGWVSNNDQHLIDAGAGPIEFIDEDGTRHYFGQSWSGGYVSPAGLYLNLVKNADGTYTMTDSDGTKRNFNTSGHLASVVDTNGNTTTYTYDANNHLTTIKDASGRSYTLAYGTNGYVSSVTDPAGHTMSYAYDTNGNLTKVTNAGGSVTTFAYDANHLLTSNTDARNITRTIAYDTSSRVKTLSQPLTIGGTMQTATDTYSYDTTNLVTTVTDGEGRRIDYSYNPNGNVVQVTANPLDSANKAVTTYAYDDNNNMTQMTDPNANSKGSSNAYVYTYDANGNITARQLPGSQTAQSVYDSNNNLTQDEDFNSNTSSYNYDTNNNNTESTDASTQTVAQRYDKYGNQAWSTNPMSAADNLVANSSFEQASNGTWPDHWTQNMQSGTTAQYALSTTSKFGGKSLSITNPTGWALANQDKIAYTAGSKYIVSAYIKTANTSSNALVKVDFYDANGNWLDQKVGSNLTGTNDWTRVSAVVDSAPTGTAYIDVAVGMNPGTGTSYFDGVSLDKGTVLPAYNLVDNSSFERLAGTLPESWTTSSNLAATDGVYTSAGSSDSNVYVGQKSFKLTGESGKNKYVIQHINLAGDGTTPLTVSGWSNQTGANPAGGSDSLQVAVNYTDGTVDWGFANGFDASVSGWQHVAATINPTKAYSSIDVYYLYYNQTGTAYFDGMRLEQGGSVTQSKYDAAGNYETSTIDPQGNTTSYTYDAAGNETSLTDAAGHATSYAFDARNLLTKVTDANNGVTSYGYDLLGNQTSITDANNHTTTYAFNEWNQASSLTNALNQTTKFSYDKAGNNTGVTYANGDAVTYSYNALNRMDGIFYNGTKQWSLGYDPNGNVTSVTDAAGNATTYAYDANSRLTQMAEGSSNKIAYTYDDNGNPTQLQLTAGSSTVTDTQSYDTLNHLITLGQNGTTQATFVYDERGNIMSVTRNNKTYSTFEYDGSNRVTMVRNFNATGTLLDSYAYVYDKAGNVASITTKAGTTTYAYDANNQLTKETLPDGTITTYAYDPAGNRTSKAVTKSGTTTTTTYTYDAGNELTAVNGKAYTYNANGDLTSNGSQTYVYDADNNLIQVKDSTGATLASFTYDNDGKRLTMTTSTGTIHYHDDGDKVAYETDASNNITASYTYDSHDQPLAMTKNGYTYYYHLNGHGDVMSLTDGSGNTVASYQYDAYGNITSQSGSMATANPYRYAGYRFDDATGLYDLNARYYDPNTGRFLTRDTFQGKKGDPLSQHVYTYARNNPVLLTDPTGHSYKHFSYGLGFGSYVAFSMGATWGKISIKLTSFFIIEQGIFFSTGGPLTEVVVDFAEVYLQHRIVKWLGSKIGKQVISLLVHMLHKHDFGYVTRAYKRSNTTVFNRSFYLWRYHILA